MSPPTSATLVFLIGSLTALGAHGLLAKKRTGAGRSAVAEPPEHPEISMTPDSELFGPPFSIPLVGTDGSQKNIYVPIQMQLAITPDEDHHGLMFKKSMDEDAGMLFLYKGGGHRVLYMRNTLIPLDAGWFTHDGTLQEVMQMKTPEDETWRWSERSDIQFGLEMNTDWFKNKGLTPGEVKLDMNALKVAILNRGYKLEDYGLVSDDATEDKAVAPSAPAVPSDPAPAAAASDSDPKMNLLSDSAFSAVRSDEMKTITGNADRMSRFLDKAEERYMNSA